MTVKMSKAVMWVVILCELAGGYKPEMLQLLLTGSVSCPSHFQFTNHCCQKCCISFCVKIQLYSLFAVLFT